MTAAGTAAAGAVFLSGRPSLTNWSNTGRGMSLASGLHLLNPAASAYFMYQGYQEGGLAGARDTAVWDVATNSAFAKYGYTKGAASAGMSSTKVARGFVGTSMRFAGGWYRRWYRPGDWSGCRHPGLRCGWSIHRWGCGCSSHGWDSSCDEGCFATSDANWWCCDGWWCLCYWQGYLSYTESRSGPWSEQARHPY